MKKYILSIVLLMGGVFSLPLASAQQKTATAKDDIEYESIADDPYDLNKMWLHLYPVYADVFMTNLNAGFGIQAQYLWKNKMDFRLHARKAYYKGSDFSYGIGEKSKEVLNSLIPQFHLEGGAAYHFIDKADQGEGKVIIYTKRYSEGKWASTVPEYIIVPAKVRKILSARLGGIFWQSSTNLGHALDIQNVTLKGSDGSELASEGVDSDGKKFERKIYSNVHSSAIYLGAALGRIRNVVVKPKKYDIAVNDVIFTGYADLIFAPGISIEDVEIKDPQTGEVITYSTASVKKSPFGFRLGFEGMYNREFSWSYGAEVGLRPSIQGRTLFVGVKVGFAFASKLDQRRQAYQKEQ